MRDSLQYPTSRNRILSNVIVLLFIYPINTQKSLHCPKWKSETLRVSIFNITPRFSNNKQKVPNGSVKKTAAKQYFGFPQSNAPRSDGFRKQRKNFAQLPKSPRHIRQTHIHRTLAFQYLWSKNFLFVA